MQKGAYITVFLLSLAGISLLFSTINLSIDKKELSINIENKEKTKKKIERELAKITKEKERVEKNLQEVIQAKMNTQLQLSKAKSEIEVLGLKIDFGNKEKQILSSELEKRKRKENSLNELVDRIKQEKKDLLAKLKGWKENKKKEIVLDKIVIKADEFPKEILGEVLVVNKKYNFLILNAGKNKGLKTGLILTIYRNGEIRGKARIEEIYNNTSEAIILEGEEITEGDEIRVLQK